MASAFTVGEVAPTRFIAPPPPLAPTSSPLLRLHTNIISASTTTKTVASSLLTVPPPPLYSFDDPLYPTNTKLFLRRLFVSLLRGPVICTVLALSLEAYVCSGDGGVGGFETADSNTSAIFPNTTSDVFGGSSAFFASVESSVLGWFTTSISPITAAVLLVFIASNVVYFTVNGFFYWITPPSYDHLEANTKKKEDKEQSATDAPSSCSSTSCTSSSASLSPWRQSMIHRFSRYKLPRNSRLVPTTAAMIREAVTAHCLGIILQPLLFWFTARYFARAVAPVCDVTTAWGSSNYRTTTTTTTTTTIALTNNDVHSSSSSSSGSRNVTFAPASSDSGVSVFPMSMLYDYAHSSLYYLFSCLPFSAQSSYSSSAEVGVEGTQSVYFSPSSSVFFLFNFLDQQQQSFVLHFITTVAFFSLGLFLHETTAYWFHRLTHDVSYLYRKIHKPHHFYVVPVSVAGDFSGPLDLIANSFTYMAIVAVVPSTRPLVLFVWALFRFYEVYEVHSGFCFNQTFLGKRLGMFCGERQLFHDFHHTANKGNYGMGFFWDYVCGTDAAYVAHLKALRAEKQKAVVAMTMGG